MTTTKTKLTKDMKRYLILLYLIFFGSLITNDIHGQKKTYQIGVLLDDRTSEIEPVFQILQNQVKVVVGEDANIVFDEDKILINNLNLEKAKQNYAQLLSDDTDIILAFGVVNNVILSNRQEYPKPTILFGAVNRDLVTVDIQKTTSEITNFTYLIESESYEEDLKIFKELTDFSTVGIVIEQEYADILPLDDLFGGLLSRLGSTYKLIPFDDVNDIIAGAVDIDAIYFAGGFFLSDDEISMLANQFIELSIPSFTSTGIQDIELGLFATNQGEENFDQFMRRIALNVEAYVNGTDLSELPVFIKYNPRLIINYNTADLIGVPLKYSLLATTDFVGEFINVKSEIEYNLLSAIAAGLSDNLGLAINEKDIDLSQQDIALAKSNYLPKVTTNASAVYVDPKAAANSFGQNPQFSTSGSVSIQQTVFAPTVRADIEIKELLYQAQQASFDANQLDLILDVSNAYFNTLILKANTQIQLQNLELTKRNHQIAKQNYEAGQTGKSDVLRFRSEMAQNTQNLVQAINQLEQGFIALNQVLNNPLNKEIDVVDVDLGKGVFERYNYDEVTELLDDPQLRETFIEFLVDEAKLNAPELKSLDYNIKANQRSIELFDKGRYYPTVALQAQYNRTFSRHGAGREGFQGLPLLDDNYNIGASISMPIFNQNLNNINEQTSHIQKEQLLLNRDNIEQNISTNVRFNILNVANQLSNINLSEVFEKTALEALELTQVAYSSGSVNIIQLIDAQNNYLNAQLAYANAIYNFLLNTVQMERSLGYFFLLNTEEDNKKFRDRFWAYINTINDDE